MREMRAAVILGPGCSSNHLKPFQLCPDVTWSFGLPSNRPDADVVLIFGGDGTIHHHLTQIVELDLPVLIVPCGSGNDFARGVNLRTASDSLQAWKEFVAGGINVRNIDLGIITELHPNPDPPESAHYFCAVGSVGLDAQTARRANALPRWIRGHGGYALSLPFALRKFTSFAATLAPKSVAETKPSNPTLTARLVLAAFANTPTYGHGIRITPRAQLDDGKLDVCAVSHLSKMRLLRVFPSVYFGHHLALPQVNYFQTEKLRIDTETPLDVYADGEYVCRTPIEVSVARQILKVVTPGS